jgi:DNA replication protein DnaC
MTQADASLSFRLVSYRYRRGSTVITTNKSDKDWPGIFAGDETMTAAILNRLLHKSVVLKIRGRSYRLQDLERLVK